MCIFPRVCDECGQPEERFRFCESRCMFRLALNAHFFYSSMALAAEISACIISVPSLLRETRCEGLY
jgi:hypothetical protein